MTRSLLLSTALTILVPLSLTTAPALAQDTDDQPVETFDAQNINLDAIVVTASPIARPLGQTISAVVLINGEELRENLGNSIGETLRSQPGISSTAFGAGAGRPIIRGLGGDRVRVLEDSLGTFDVGQTSPDHAVPVEPALANSIEVLRGPASLLYGSSAVGGVVNVDTGKIPSALPEGGIDAAARYAHSTVNNGDEFAVGANVGLGNIVLHGEYSYREADDYDIPGISGSDALIAQFTADDPDFDPLERFGDGVVPNSDLENQSGAGGISYIFDGAVDGFLGFSVSIFDTNYGVPAGILTEEDLEGEEEEEGGEEEEEGEEEGIRIDLEQIKYNIAGEFNGEFGPIETIKINLGYGDYEHAELEGDEIGTQFTNDEFEGRIELVSRPFSAFGGEVRGAYGIQGRFRDVSAVGAEAFIPPSEQTQIGIFALHEYVAGAAVIDLGLRYENVNNSTETFVAEEDGPEMAIENSFNLFSVSGGVGYSLAENMFVGVNGFRTERAPSVEENFSFGPHLATQLFEVGDPTFDEEVATGVEGTIRGEFGPLTAVFNAFYTSYDNFIFEQETGEELDGLPVFAFVGADATFRGFEAEVDLALGALEMGGMGDVRFSAHAQADMVRGTINDLADEDLPRIPPLSTTFGLGAVNEYFGLRTEIEYVTSQDNVAAFEFTTDDFVFVNTYLTIRPFGSRKNLALEVRGRNLNNAEGRVHASFLKETTPLPGRDIRFTIRAGF
ncbi:MAG: TonB-dependent receptor [Pseudomonadota bacterium]